MGYENKEQNSAESATSSQGSSQTEGIYLFGDYSPYAENKNIIDMLKDFVSISEHVLQIHGNVDKLNFLLKNTEILRESLNVKINQFKTSCEAEMDTFFNEFYEKLAKVYFPDQVGAEPFLKIKNSMVRSITDVERECITSFDEYKTYLGSKRNDFHMSSVILLQAWLSKDKNNLPNMLISRATNVLIAKVEDVGEGYRISRSTEITLGTAEEYSNTQTSSVSYSFYVDASTTSFWKNHRKVIDLEIDQISIPIGFKTSISEKLRRSFRLGHSNDYQHDSEREPEMVSVENYYMTHAKLECGRSLSVILSAESRPTNKVIKIEYDLNDLHAGGPDPSANESSSNYEQLIAEGRVPRVEYINEKENRRIDLLQKEFQRATDITRIMIMGGKLEEKLQQLLDIRSVSSYIRLYSITVDDKEAVVMMNNQSPDGHLSYHEDLVVSFLGSIASGFEPVIQMLMVKSPIKGELILRYDSPDKQREEYMIRVSDIISRLSSSNAGRSVLSALGLTYEGGADSEVENISKS